MSVRAYHLIEVKYEKPFTFNLNEERITNLADDTNQDILTFQKETLKGELSGVRAELKGLSGDADEGEYKNNLLDVETTLEQMIKECGDEEYVEYYCF